MPKSTWLESQHFSSQAPHVTQSPQIPHQPQGAGVANPLYK